jgi:hypothetical protein
VWDGCYERDIEKFEKIQLEGARIVTVLTKFASKDLFLSEETVGEFLIDMSKLFQSETVDGINELADVLSLHLGGTY